MTWQLNYPEQTVAVQAPSTQTLGHLVERAGRLARRTTAMRWCTLMIAVLMFAAMLTILLDATFALSASALLAIDVAFVLALLTMPFVIRRIARRIAPDPRHMARLLEQRGGVCENELINALELGAADRSAPGISGQLVDVTVDTGERMATGINAAIVVDRAQARAARRWLLAVPIIALLLHLALPTLFSSVLRRFADPFGFHPPFSMLRFELAINPAPVRYGQPAVVDVFLDGATRAAEAELVFVDPAHPDRPLDALPMLPVATSSDDADLREHFALRLERVTEAATVYVRTPQGRSELRHIEVLPVPSFERVGLTLHPPAYTRWPPQDGVFHGDIEALHGSELMVSAVSSLPLREATLRLVAEDGSVQMTVLRPSAADPHVAVGTLRAVSSGALELELLGADGTVGDEKRTATLLVQSDGRPRITILEPEDHAIVVEGWAIDVMFEAEDDVGIERMEVLRGINGFPPFVAPLLPSGGDATRTLARVHFDTKVLGARPGDVLTCSAIAWDGHPDPPQSVTSRTVMIEVISESEYAELTRVDQRVAAIAKEAEEIEAALEALAREREELLKDIDAMEAASAQGEPQDAALQKRLDDYAQKSKELAATMRERAEQPAVYDAEMPWQEALNRQAEGLDKQQEVAEQLSEAMEACAVSGDSDAGPKAARSDAAMAMKAETDPFDALAADDPVNGGDGSMADDLQAMAMAEELLARTEQIRQAILEQRAIADQMAALRQKSNQRAELTPPDQLRLSELAEDQESLRQELDGAKDALQAAADAAAERLPNMSAAAEGICAALEASEASTDQRDASKAGENGDARAAHDAAQRAAEKLEGLLSECNSESMSEPMNGDLDGCLSMPKPSLKNALQQMANARLGAMSRMAMGKRGKSGSGFSGMSPSASIHGPHQPQGDATKESRHVGDDRESKAAADGRLGDRRAAAAERLTSGRSKAKTSGGGGLDGVPAAYRDVAAAYFQRLSKDARLMAPVKPPVPTGAEEKESR
ncbi:MAG: hypothetical protein SGJ11_01420 [Phycisphaerae bacterium]|nr:hypothetical protein [Phycisphaerae bacterium]